MAVVKKILKHIAQNKVGSDWPAVARLRGIVEQHLLIFQKRKACEQTGFAGSKVNVPVNLPTEAVAVVILYIQQSAGKPADDILAVFFTCLRRHGGFLLLTATP